MVKLRSTGLTVNVDDSVSDRIDGQVKTSLQNYLNKFDADLDVAESTYYRPENVRDTIVSLTPAPVDGWYLVEGATVAPLDVENNNLVLIQSGAISDRYEPKESDRIIVNKLEKRFVNGKWHDKLLYVYAADFGAVGDGTTDDTTAIQAALDYCGALLQKGQDAGIGGVSQVILPGGTFKISSTLTIRNGTTLIGQTKAPPYPNRLSGFKSNDNLFTGTEIVCTSDFTGDEAILLEPDNTNLEGVILDGHAIACGTTWTQINVTTAQGRWISTSFIRFPVQDPSDTRIQSFGFANIEIPYFQIGEYQEYQLQGIGGTGTYTFSLTSGALPTGLSISSSGLISGTATELQTTYPVFEVDDGTDSFSRTFTLGTVLDEIKTREILPPTVGASYSFQLETWQGTAGLTWKGLSLPDWLSLSSSGELTNNRTTTADDVKFFDFKIELYDGSDLLDKRAFHSQLRYADGAVKIFGEQTLKPETDTAFSSTYKGHGGYGDFTWSINAARSAIAGNTTAVTATSPYTNLTLNTATGEISGTPTAAGKNTYYLRATSNTDNTLFFEGLFYIEVIEAGETPKLYTRSFPTATKDNAYSYQFNVEAIAGAQPYTYEAINLPSGLSMDANGLITGTPTGANFVDGIRLQWSDSVKLCTIRGFRSGAGILSNNNPSNVHRIANCMISVCDRGIGIDSQAYDSHMTEMYIFNCRVGIDMGAGGAAWSFNGGIRIEYIHENGMHLRTAHENDISGIFFDTCGWSALRAEDSRNLLVTGCRFFRSGRNVRGIGTKLHPNANVDYSNHIFLEDCPRATITGNTFDVGTKEGGDGIYLTNHSADNIRPEAGIRIHNTPELTIVGNNLTGCVGNAIDANLSDFGENNYHGYNIANNAQSDRELVALEVAKLAKDDIYIPNKGFKIWQRDKDFSIPPSAAAETFPIADFWQIKRGASSVVDQTITVNRRTDGKIGDGFYLHLEKPRNTSSGNQTLELSNFSSSNLALTSDRNIIFSYYARSANNTSLGVKLSQYPASGDNGWRAYSHQDNNRTISSKWQKYQHYFQLNDLTDINFGDSAIFNIIFRCDQGTEDIDIDITEVDIKFVDQIPFAAEIKESSFENELAYAQRIYQKSKPYDEYFPSWVNEVRYDVNGGAGDNGAIEQIAITTDGHSLKETVAFNSPITNLDGSPVTLDKLVILNPFTLETRTHINRFRWTGGIISNVDYLSNRGFTVSARGQTVTAGQSYQCQWLVSAYESDRVANGGGY